jgi:thiamine pyrophosphokinase
MRVVIIANGEPPTQHDIARWLRTGDRLICADGGAKAALALGLRPQHVIGDFDSLTESDLAELVRRGTTLHRHSPRKDETDLELALLFAMRSLTPTTLSEREGQRSEIIVLGARGGRIDHELANILLLAMPAMRGTRVIIAHGPERMWLIDARLGEALSRIDATPGDIVSLLPFGGDALGVRTDGLEYPLRDESLYIGPARGVSNVMLGDVATVSLRQGMLLCVITSAEP